MSNLNIIDWLAVILLIIGGLNWGLVGLFNLDVVKMILGDMTLFSRIVYIVVGLAGIYMIFLATKLVKK